MPVPGGLLSGKLRAAYEVLAASFEDAGINANCGLTKWADPISAGFKLTDGGQVTFEAYAHLDWRARKERVHILIHIQELIERASEALLKSTVHVCYYEVEGSTAKLLHSIHFDYGKAEDSHPRFHAQLCPEPIALARDVAEKLEFLYDIQPPSSATCFKEARIPTSDMTFPSVLLCLAADHLEQPFFSEFRESVLKHQENMPQPNFDSLKGSIAAEPNHLRSSHWFAHMPSAE